MFRHFHSIMELYIIEDYREIYPDLKGSALTDKLTEDCVRRYGLQEFHILRTQKGKPYIANSTDSKEDEEMNDTNISVSHSGNIFVCIVSEKPVGIDVQHRRVASTEKIADRYFKDEENAYVAERGENGFFTLWTRKEAYSKLTGKGLEEIIGGASVLDREDVEFTDMQLEEGVWCSYCIKR